MTSSVLLVIVDEMTRASARPERLSEWDAALRALAERNVFATPLDGAHRMVVTLDGEALYLQIEGSAGQRVAQGRVPIAPLRRLIGDYVLLMNRIHTAEEGFGSPRLDTLDMAKKVYHDEAAEVVRRALAGTLGPDLETARRLFTLLLVMVHDTSAAWIA